jgi:hypothetical protein
MMHATTRRLIAWQISLGMASLGRLLILVLLMCHVPPPYKGVTDVTVTRRQRRKRRLRPPLGQKPMRQKKCRTPAEPLSARAPYCNI